MMLFNIRNKQYITNLQLNIVINNVTIKIVNKKCIGIFTFSKL